MKIREIRNFINKTYETSLPKDLTLVEFRELEKVYEDLLMNGKSKTILYGTAIFCQKFNLKVREKGIGFEISI